MSRATTASTTTKKGATGAASKQRKQSQQKTAANSTLDQQQAIDHDNDDHADDAQDYLFERAADQLFQSEYLLVLIGPSFDEGGLSRNPLSFEHSHYKMAQYPSKFFGFWGNFYNDAMERQPHSGYHILSRWRDSAFAQGTGPGGSKVNKPVGPPPDDDQNDKKGKSGEGGKSNYQLLQQRMFCMTSLVSNMPVKAGIPQDEVYEVCGNVTQWQCGQNNRCGPPFTFLLDRGVTFDVDECTQEALPLKYVPPTEEDFLSSSNNHHLDDPASLKNRKSAGGADHQQQQSKDPFQIADRLAMSDNDAEDDDYDRLVRSAKLYERNPDYYASSAGDRNAASSLVAAAAAGRSALASGAEAVFKPMQANSAFNNFESKVGRDERVRRDLRRENRGKVIRVKKEWQFGACNDPTFPQDPFKGFVTEIPLPIKQMPVPQSHQFQDDDSVRTEAQAEYEANQVANLMINGEMPSSQQNENSNGDGDEDQQAGGENQENNNNENGSNADEKKTESSNNNNNQENNEENKPEGGGEQPNKPFNPLLSRPTSSTKPISIHKVVNHNEKLISHLYCHSQVVDRGVHSERIGSFQLVEAKKYATEREALYAAFSGQKSYTLENSNAFARRANTIRYNISMVFMTDATSDQQTFSANFNNNNNDGEQPNFNGTLSGSHTNNLSLLSATSPRSHQRTHSSNQQNQNQQQPSIIQRPSVEERRLLGEFHNRVLPEDVAEALFRPDFSNHSSSLPQNQNQNQHHHIISNLEAKQYASEFLRDKSKIQGKNGWYFFSHIAPSRTCQEPIRGLLYDQVRVSDFPEYRKKDFESIDTTNQNMSASQQAFQASSFNRSAASTLGPGSFTNNNNNNLNKDSAAGHTVPLVRRIPPQGGKVSIVVDMLQIFNLGAGPNVIPTYEYSSRTFQIVGYLPPPLVAGQEFSSTTAGEGGHRTGTGGGTMPRTFGTTSAAAAAAAGPKYLEYLLETHGNCPFVVKIGVLASAPSIIQYVEFDVPCGRAESAHIAQITGRSGAGASSSDSKQQQNKFAASMNSALAQKAANTLGGAAALLKPVPNHIFCPHCRGLARPHVTMVPISSPPGTKDPLFCTTAQNPKSRLFSGWLKLILDSLKQDQTKSLCILELGAERKNDATKSLGERTFKTMVTTAGGRLRYVRLSQTPLDASKLVKKKGGAGSSSSNAAASAGPPAGGRRGNAGSGGGEEEGEPFVAIVCNPAMGLSRLDSLLYDRMRKR